MLLAIGIDHRHLFSKVAMAISKADRIKRSVLMVGFLIGLTVEGLFVLGWRVAQGSGELKLPKAFKPLVQQVYGSRLSVALQTRPEEKGKSGNLDSHSSVASYAG